MSNYVRDNELFTIVSDWSEIPAYKRTLEKVPGDNGVSLFQQTVKEHMREFNNTARQLYENWKSAVFPSG